MNFNQIYPDQAVAIYTREQANKLVQYDHHRVTVTNEMVAGMQETSDGEYPFPIRIEISQ